MISYQQRLRGTLNPPPLGTFTKSSPAGRRDTNGTAAVSSDFNGEGCDEIAITETFQQKSFPTFFAFANNKTLCSPDFLRFFFGKVLDLSGHV